MAQNYVTVTQCIESTGAENNEQICILCLRQLVLHQKGAVVQPGKCKYIDLLQLVPAMQLIQYSQSSLSG